MAYKVVFDDSAIVEYVEIVDYLVATKSSKTAAKNFVDKMQKILSLIEANPENFGLIKFKQFKKLGFHKVNINNYLMLYKVKSNKVYIKHIFHQSQDYANLV